jgi:hypothetical protein
VATVALLVVAVLLFAAAAGGGFVAARTLAGQGLVPPATSTPSTPPPTQPPSTAPLTLVHTTGAAATVNGMTGGNFTIDVPAGWQMFLEQRNGKGLPAGGAVHYVKPDGTQEVTVEWYPDYYPHANIPQYLQALHDIWPSSADFAINAEPITAIDGLGADAAEPAEELGYRTVDGSSTGDVFSPNAHRTTYADLLPRSYDLWVVSVTVVTQMESTSKTQLFDKIKTTFRPTS